MYFAGKLVYLIVRPSNQLAVISNLQHKVTQTWFCKVMEKAEITDMPIRPGSDCKLPTNERSSNNSSKENVLCIVKYRTKQGHDLYRKSGVIKLSGIEHSGRRNSALKRRKIMSGHRVKL